MSQPVKKRDNPTLIFRRLNVAEWGKICSTRFTPATQTVIGMLYAQDSEGRANDVLRGFYLSGARGCYAYSRLAQANTEFRKTGLPYRLRRRYVPADSTGGIEAYYVVQICTVEEAAA